MSEGEAKTLPIGSVVHERYRILAVIGQGGLGVVYRVTDVTLGTPNVYALKELVDQSSGARKQFEMEGQWLQSVKHDHIPKVREHFEWHERLYLVMDFIQGENLEQKLTRTGGRPLMEAQVLRWIVPICDALDYLHGRTPPILHRDVKPANIIVTPSGHPVLVDLGIAKEHLPGANQTATFVRRAGTEGYAPPEQYTAAGQTGPWSDVYGLGATLYHLLTGRIPPTAVERVALDMHLIAPITLNPALSPHVDATILRTLALRPAERIQSMRDVAFSLTYPQDAPVPPDVAPRLPTPPASTERDSGALYHPFAPPAPPRAAPTPAPPWPPVVATPAPFSPFGGAPPAPSAQPGVTLPPLEPLDPYSIIRNHASDGVPRSPLPSSAPQLSNSPNTLPAFGGPGVSRPSAGTASSQLRRMDSQSDLSFAALVAGSASGEHGSVVTRQRRRVLTPQLGVGAALIVVLAAVVVGFFLFQSSPLPDRSTPTATTKGYFAAIHAQDYPSAWRYVAASRNNPGAQSDFTSNVSSDDQRLGKVQVASIISATTDVSGKATVTVSVVRERAPTSTYAYTLTLVQYDGSTWLISSITNS